MKRICQKKSLCKKLAGNVGSDYQIFVLGFLSRCRLSGLFEAVRYCKLNADDSKIIRVNEDRSSEESLKRDINSVKN